MISVEEMLRVEKCFWCGSNKFKRIAERKDRVGVQECLSCHLLQVAEIPEDLSVYYDEEVYFNPEGDTETGYHENYDLISPFYLYWQGALLEEIARRGKRKTLLEVGCATGNALEMIKLQNKNMIIQGIDLSSYAINVCKQKGLNAEVSTINDFKGNSKFDIIFSSETMEHVDVLRGFVEGVKNNLEKNGVYVFYVPAVERRALIEQGKDYPSLTTSLEHVSYFTNSFLERALTEAFDASVYVHTISTSGENYHLGIVSADGELVAYVKKFIEGFETYSPEFDEPKTLYNLVAIATKFGNFDVAAQYLADLEKTKFPSKDLSFLRGIICYSKGELVKAKGYFNKYLGEAAASSFMLKVFLAVEKELNKIYKSEVIELKKLEPRVFKLESELKDLQESKLVGNSIRLRHLIGKILNPVRNFKKKNIARAKRLIVRLIPRKLRKPIKYVIRLQWLIKNQVIDNQAPAAGQPLVSVVIPFYNQAATLPETLSSLRNQTFQNFDVTIVNDGSNPDQAEALERITDKKLRVIHHKKNLGQGSPAAARNSGVKQAKGHYIVCLDSDDILDPTYIEKCLIVLETNPNADLATTDTLNFGVVNSVYRQEPYNAFHLLDNNMVVTAAMYNKVGWERVGGYKVGIGYEDWDFWISLAENGYWGAHIAEPIFIYRTALSSRYVEDKTKHKNNMQKIKDLHPNYYSHIRKVHRHKYFNNKSVSKDTRLINLNNPATYLGQSNKNKNILVAVPWMTFGGAETLIVNFCKEIQDRHNISFITGLYSEHEWEYKFKEISPRVYHLANLFSDENKDMKLEFVSNYINTRDIHVLHIIHTASVFYMLPEIRRRHPDLKIVITMFNDIVEHFEKSLSYEKYTNAYTTDNATVAAHYQKRLTANSTIKVLPNGINCYDIFNPDLYNKSNERASLGIGEQDIAVFFVGRLSVEKNPDIFLAAAQNILKSPASDRLRFFIIGDGPMRPDVERIIKNINSKSVQYLGYQSEIAKYLSAADIFVLPSSIEGFPLSILEAMAMKVAVIASDVGAVAEVIKSGEDGFVVPAASAPAITKTIENLVNNPALIEKVKNNGRRAVEEKYSNKVLGSNYTKLYKDLLK